MTEETANRLAAAIEKLSFELEMIDWTVIEDLTKAVNNHG